MMTRFGLWPARVPSRCRHVMVGDGKLPEERVFLTDVDLTTSDDGKVQSRLNITAGS